MSIIKILKSKYFMILMFITIIVSIHSVSAGMYDFPEDIKVKKVNVYDSDIITSGKTKYTIVNLNEEVKFVAETSKVDRVNWNFGDKTPIINTTTKDDVSTITHTFKKVGTYKIKVDIEKTYLNVSHAGGLYNPTYREEKIQIIKVKVVKKPDLIITKINYPRDAKNVGGIVATVKNKGSISSKACQIKAWYKDKKLKQYTKSVKVPVLKAGKSTQIVIKFQIPSKYKKNVKYLKVDSTNKVSESIKSNNRKTFK